MKKYILECIVFISGAIVMVYELVGSRLISPYVGTSLYVWSSLIGVILGALSLGYYLGGKLADKKAEWKFFSGILFFAAIFIGLTVFTKHIILEAVALFNIRSEYTALIASLFLFAPASILLGMISPFSVKLRIKSLESSASTVGNLYAISTIGSIAGTFSAGFFIIPFFGTTKILFFMTVVLLGLSLIASRKAFFKVKIALMCLFIGLMFFGNIHGLFTKRGMIDTDTPYNKVWISYETKGGKPIVVLYTDPFAAQSAMYLHDGELVFRYTKYFRLAKHFNPNINTALMIGGCGYSYPKDFLKEFLNSTMDVVEIDPGMTKIARKYFALHDNARLKIFHEDARTFLNRTENKYDVIYGDAFNSFNSVPFQLATREAVGKMYRALNNDGLVIQNIISAINGKKGEFLRAEIATYKKYFPHVYIFRVNNEDSHESQNIILIAFKNAARPSFESADRELNTYLKSLWKEEIVLDMPVITDDHAPVEYYKYRSM
ncbi:MAG: Spermine synthase [Deltaproteobacteria bacterium]|nr:Spermine synthase [Deltaproteobacteria bacterium]